jgi:hypothetical protein
VAKRPAFAHNAAGTGSSDPIDPATLAQIEKDMAKFD